MPLRRSGEIYYVKRLQNILVPTSRPVRRNENRVWVEDSERASMAVKICADFDSPKFATGPESRRRYLAALPWPRLGLASEVWRDHERPSLLNPRDTHHRYLSSLVGHFRRHRYPDNTRSLADTSRQLIRQCQQMLVITAPDRVESAGSWRWPGRN